MLRVIFEERKILNSSGSLKNQLKMMYIFLVIIFLLTLIGGFIFITESKKPKISIIIPVYNTEKYLDECLNSVENQTLKDIEIICVNDGSTDKSLEILNNHAGKDSRIKVISQENGGVSSARNAGIESSSGSYILFIDSDDFIETYLCKNVYDLAKKSNADIVRFNSLDFNDGEVLDCVGDENNYDKNKIKLRVRRNCSENPFTGNLNFDSDVIRNKLWKKSVISKNNLWFVSGIPIGEDTLFNWMSAPYVHRLIDCSNILYYRRVNRENSLMTLYDKNTIKKLNGYYVIVKELFEKYYSDNYINFEGKDEWVISRCILLLYYPVVNDIKDETLKREYAKKSSDIIDFYTNKYGVKLNGFEEKVDELRKFAGI